MWLAGGQLFGRTEKNLPTPGKTIQEKRKAQINSIRNEKEAITIDHIHITQITRGNGKQLCTFHLKFQIYQDKFLENSTLPKRTQSKLTRRNRKSEQFHNH